MDLDLAISGRAASYEGIVDVPLGPVRPVLCAAPSYMKKRPLPSHPRELADMDCLVFSATGTTWSFHSSRGTLNIDVRARLLADDNLTLLHATTAGLGIALLPSYLALAPLKSGQLQPVLQEFAPQENWFKAYVPKRRMNVGRVKALLGFMQKNWAVGQAG